MKGTFTCVGVGPGDPELMTLKAVRLLESCPVIAAPRTKSGQTLALDIAGSAVDLTQKVILPLTFTMERETAAQTDAHGKAVEQLREHLDQGRDVAMLSLGDVSIYATCCYLMEILQRAGYPTAMIPGVPSFCAAAAALETSLTTMNGPLHILPAGGIDLEQALSLPGVKVLMKAGKRLPEVLDVLRRLGLQDKAALVKNCGLPGEEICRSVSDWTEQGGYFCTIVVKG